MLYDIHWVNTVEVMIFGVFVCHYSLLISLH